MASQHDTRRHRLAKPLWSTTSWRLVGVWRRGISVGSHLWPRRQGGVTERGQSTLRAVGFTAAPPLARGEEGVGATRETKTPAVKLEGLRAKMKELSLDCYIIPSDDPHLSGECVHCMVVILHCCGLNLLTVIVWTRRICTGRVQTKEIHDGLWGICWYGSCYE